LDPRSRIIGAISAQNLISIGKYDNALDRVDQTLAFAPDFPFGWQVKGFIHITRHEFAQARAAFEKKSEIIGKTNSELAAVDLIEGFVRTGKPAEPPPWISDPNMIDPYYAAFTLVCAGQYEAALDMVEQQTAGNIREIGVFFLNSALFREKMGDMPRYQELVRRLAMVGDRTQ
jgi:tetratricopeptide (TPR) repeat protein